MYGHESSSFFPMPKADNQVSEPQIPKRTTSSIERGLQTMLQSKDNVLQCEHCGSRILKFNGLGEYICSKCGRSTYNNYGKVRAHLDLNGAATIAEVCAATGLTRADIQDLIDSNSISVTGGKIWL